MAAADAAANKVPTAIYKSVAPLPCSPQLSIMQQKPKERKVANTDMEIARRRGFGPALFVISSRQ
jgi:hypothetical protein